MTERNCEQCGTPVDVGSSVTITRVLCDDICAGAYWDRRPHFWNGNAGPLCGELTPSGVVTCSLHHRLALLEARYREPVISREPV